MGRPVLLSATVGAPLRHSIDSARGLLLIELLDITDVAATIAACAAIAKDPVFGPQLNVCVDCSALRRPPSADQVCELACAYVVHAAPGLTGTCAIVASSSSLYDAARHFAIVAADLKARVRVFQSRDEASAWLNRDTASSIILRRTVWDRAAWG